MKINKHRLIDALKKLILFTAIIHLILLVFYSIIKYKIIYLNYFNILDLDLLFPKIINGFLSQIFSILIILIIYLIIFFKFTKTEK